RSLASSTSINFSLKIFQAKKGLPEGQFSTFWTAPFLLELKNINGLIGRPKYRNPLLAVMGASHS
ncbi:hypothetical protein, partial [Fictibacillus sp. FJAT-27399]|uniref:hypothetical protein n=1 Tax=Fictibacillus sp. FJAT-27399 TaxID=1729689 RepID=UPI001F3F736B